MQKELKGDTKQMVNPETRTRQDDATNRRIKYPLGQRGTCKVSLRLHCLIITLQTTPTQLEAHRRHHHFRFHFTECIHQQCLAKHAVGAQQAV